MEWLLEVKIHTSTLCKWNERWEVQTCTSSPCVIVTYGQQEGWFHLLMSMSTKHEALCLFVSGSSVRTALQPFQKETVMVPESQSTRANE